MIQGNRGDRQAGCDRRPALPPAPGRLLVRARSAGARVVLHDLRDGLAHRRRHARRSTSARATTAPTTTAASSSRPGVAHGFAALTDMTITYLVDGYYNPADELGVAWDDPAIDADWGVDRPDPVRPRPARTRGRADIDPTTGARTSALRT